MTEQEITYNIISLITAIYFMYVVYMINARNSLNKFVFKFIPTILILAMLLQPLKFFKLL